MQLQEFYWPLWGPVELERQLYWMLLLTVKILVESLETSYLMENPETNFLLGNIKAAIFNIQQVLNIFEDMQPTLHNQICCFPLVL